MCISGVTQWVLKVDKIYYTFDDYLCDTEAVAALVEESNFKPDVIVGILRGGAIPAVQLSHMLDKPVYTFAFSTRDKKIVEEESFDKLMEIFSNGHKVLFIDDINDSGKTFMQILTYLARHNIGEKHYKLASLVYNKNSQIQSDYYGMVIEKIDDSPWVQFWWEASNA